MTDFTMRSLWFFLGGNVTVFAMALIRDGAVNAGQVLALVGGVSVVAGMEWLSR